MEIQEKILKILDIQGKVTTADLARQLDISDRFVRKQLSILLKEGKVGKAGTPPTVYYYILKIDTSNVDIAIKEKIDESYLYITPTGEYYEGFLGFTKWCEKTKQDIISTSQNYIETIEKYSKFKDKETYLIDGMSKIKGTYSTVHLDEVYYIDFYSIERYGKTKLGQLLLYAKQNQNMELIRKATEIIKPKIEAIIKEKNIDGICFVPPTVKRKIQLMEEIQSILNLSTNIVKISKIKTEIIVPQKTLSKLSDRVANAEKTFQLLEDKIYNNILIIDDAVGSGATMNEIAKKIKEKGICKGKVIGLAMTGSFSGFDIINEV